VRLWKVGRCGSEWGARVDRRRGENGRRVVWREGREMERDGGRMGGDW